MAAPGNSRLLLILFWLFAGAAIGIGLDRMWRPPRTSDLHLPASQEINRGPSLEAEKVEKPVPVVASPPGSSPAAAIEELRRMSVLDEGALAAIARSWSRRDPRAALAWVEGLSAKEAERAWSQFTLDVRQLGVDETFNIVNAITNELVGASVAGRVGRELAAKDFREAITWAERFPPGPVREHALRPAMQKCAEADPITALTYIASLESSDARAELLGRAAENWAAKDKEAALAWARQLPAGIDRDAVMAPLIRGLAQSDPARAIEWLSTIEYPKARQGVIEQLTVTWAQKDPPAAAAWVDALTDPAEQATGRRSVGREWAVKDVPATAAWLSTLPSGPSRDAAIEGFISWADDYDRGRATAWAAAMADPKQREQLTTYTFGRWTASDPAGAQAWLKQANVSEPLRAALLRIAETGGNRMPTATPAPSR